MNSYAVSRNWLRVFLWQCFCLNRYVQAKNVFFRVLASAIGETFVFSDDFKTAFLQHSYRPDVVRCCPGEYRPSYNKVEHPIERLSCYSFSPELPAKPIGDFHFFSIRKARYVTSNLSV